MCVHFINNNNDKTKQKKKQIKEHQTSKKKKKKERMYAIRIGPIIVQTPLRHCLVRLNDKITFKGSPIG